MPIKLNNLQPFLICTDHTVSNEKFDLLHHPEYDLLVTSPKPNVKNLPGYYKSENYISHTDSSKTLLDKIYQWVKSIMIQKKIRLLEKFAPQKGDLLDIGTGTGDFLKSAKKSGWEIHGTEPNKKAREIAEEKNITVKTGTNQFTNSKFDLISMWHVLEHVPDLESQIRELDRLLKKEGTLFIAVPNFKSYDANYYKEFWAAYDVPRHLWHFSKTSIIKLFDEFGFQLVETIPLKFDSYYVSLLSEKHKTGHENYFRALFTGWRSNLKAKSSGEYSSLIYVLKRNKKSI